MLDLILDSLDNVDEQSKLFYKKNETDGKHHLDPDIYAESKKSGLTAKNKELLGKLKAKEEALTKFKDFTDDDLTGYQEWKAKQAEEGDEGEPDPKKDSKGVISDDKLKKLTAERERSEKKLKDTHRAEIEAEKAKTLDAQKELRSFKMSMTLKDLALKADVLPDRLDSFLKTTGDRFTLNEHGDLIALDDEGDPLDMKPEKFIVDKLREAYPWFFKAAEQGGSGARNNGGEARGGKVIKRATFDQMNATQRAEHFKSKGQIID